MLGPRQVVVAFTPEMALPALVAEAQAVFQAEYAHHLTSTPPLALTVVDHAAVANGAA